MFSVLVAGTLIEDGVFSKREAEGTNDLIHRLILTLIRAHYDQQGARHQILAVMRMLKPEVFGVEASDIEEFVSAHYTRSDYAQAAAIRRIMSDLSWVVEPKKPGGSVLNGVIKLSDRVLPGKEEIRELASEHIAGNSTLQSLAVCLYHEELEEQGIGTTKNTLRASLRALEKYEASLSSEERRIHLRAGRETGDKSAGLFELFVPDFSDGWKRREQGPRAKRMTPGQITERRKERESQLLEAVCELSPDGTGVVPRKDIAAKLGRSETTVKGWFADLAKIGVTMDSLLREAARRYANKRGQG